MLVTILPGALRMCGLDMGLNLDSVDDTEAQIGAVRRRAGDGRHRDTG